jgi:hypothetical protein
MPPNGSRPSPPALRGAGRRGVALAFHRAIELIHSHARPGTHDDQRADGRRQRCTPLVAARRAGGAFRLQVHRRGRRRGCGGETGSRLQGGPAVRRHPVARRERARPHAPAVGRAAPVAGVHHARVRPSGILSGGARLPCLPLSRQGNAVQHGPGGGRGGDARSSRPHAGRRRGCRPAQARDRRSGGALARADRPRGARRPRRAATGAGAHARSRVRRGFAAGCGRTRHRRGRAERRWLVNVAAVLCIMHSPRVNETPDFGGDRAIRRSADLAAEIAPIVPAALARNGARHRSRLDAFAYGVGRQPRNPCGRHRGAARLP